MGNPGDKLDATVKVIAEDRETFEASMLATLREMGIPAVSVQILGLRNESGPDGAITVGCRPMEGDLLDAPPPGPKPGPGFPQRPGDKRPEPEPFSAVMARLAERGVPRAYFSASDREWVALIGVGDGRVDLTSGSGSTEEAALRDLDARLGGMAARREAEAIEAVKARLFERGGWGANDEASPGEWVAFALCVPGVIGKGSTEDAAIRALDAKLREAPRDPMGVGESAKVVLGADGFRSGEPVEVRYDDVRGWIPGVYDHFDSAAWTHCVAVWIDREKQVVTFCNSANVRHPRPSGPAVGRLRRFLLTEGERVTLCQGAPGEVAGLLADLGLPADCEPFGHATWDWDHCLWDVAVESAGWPEVPRGMKVQLFPLPGR